ncbi:MAG: SEL1-like repeat protein [Opitutaceae bacterium]|nr:SEL1-like repeat protein [Opitutaceae bacterium]
MQRTPLRTISLLFIWASSAAAQLPLFFEENFDRNTVGWTVWNNPGSGMWIRDGHYHMEIREDYNQPVRLWSDPVVFDPTRDFALETRITYRTGNTRNPNHSYWVKWGASTNAKDFYAFGIFPDGRFQYGKLTNGRWSAFTEPAIASPVIKTGENSTNVLRVERKRDDVFFSINGTQVHRARFEPFNAAHKAIAFQANGRIELDVDYLRIYQEPAAPKNPFHGLKGLYPVFKSLAKDARLYADGYLFSGPVEGNCREGDGLYVTIQRLSNNNGPYLQYWYFKGRFSDQGRKFHGQRYSKWIPLKQDKNSYVFSGGGDVNTSNLEKEAHNGFTGEFIILPTQGGYKDLPSFVLSGKGDRDLWAMEQFKWKGCSGYYHWYEPVFLAIDYDGKRTFTGLVAPGYKPMLGVMDYGNGDKYEGAWLNDKYYGPGRLTKNGQVQEGIWDGNDRLASTGKVFIPDLAVLRKAVENYGQNLPVYLTLNPFTFADSWDNKISATLWNEKGEPVDENYSGPGLAYGDNKFVYCGEFKHGKPDGTGYYRVQRWNDGNYKAGPNVYAGTFENGHFLAGVSWHKTKTNQALADRQATTSVFPGIPELLPAARLIASGRTKEGDAALRGLLSQGNAEAGYWLGKLAQDGIVEPKNLAKAVSYYTQAADKNDMPSLIALGLIYGNGAEGIPADHPKAIALLKRGAEMPVTPMVSKASVDYCRGNYFMLKYPFLSFDQAVKFSLADEGNPASELGRALAQQQEKFAAEQKKQAQKEAVAAQAREEHKISNNKHGWIKGTYLQNLKTKWIYHVSPNRPLYEGNLVELSIRNETTKATDYVYERLEALLDAQLYKKVAAPTRCGSCQGKGFTSRSYTNTVADYEYTLGKKIVQTTTHRDACGTCGGCGLVSR